MKMPIFKTVQEAIEYMQKRNMPQEFSRVVFNNILPENPREELLKYLIQLLKTTKIPEDKQIEILETLDRRIKKKLKGIKNDRKKLEIMGELVPFCMQKIADEKQKYEPVEFKATAKQIKEGCEHVLTESDLTEDELKDRRMRIEQNFAFVSDDKEVNLDEIRFLIDGICEIGMIQNVQGQPGLSLYIPSKEQRENKKETVKLNPQDIMTMDDMKSADTNTNI